MEKGNIYQLVNIYRLACIILLLFMVIDVMNDNMLFLIIDAFALVYVNLQWYVFKHAPSKYMSFQKKNEEIAQTKAEKISA